MPRRKPVVRSGRKYGHIKLEEIDFPHEIDDTIVAAFLESEEEDASTTQSVSDWNEYYDSDPEDIQIEVIFDELGKAIPVAPSTILNTCTKHTVYMWLVSDTDLKAFKKEMMKNLRQYASTYGGKIFKKEIEDAIKRGFKRGGLDRDDVIKILDEFIATEVMGS